MTEQIRAEVVGAIRQARGDGLSADEIDLARSMDAVEVLAKATSSLLGIDVDIVVTRHALDDVVLGYAVARELGCERAIVWEDLGILSTTGADLAGRRVALVTTLAHHTPGLEPVARAVQNEGATVVATIAAIDEAEFAAATTSSSGT